MAGLSLHHPWAFAFGILGNLISFMTYLAPLPTFYRIYRKKTTEGFQSVPYAVALLSATLWIYYALLKSGEWLLITINSAGIVIETIYIVVYLAYAPKQAKLFTAKILLLLNVAVFGLILLLTLLLSDGEKRVVLLGWVCVAFSVVVFVAPLAVIRLVVRTRSVEFLPFSLSLSLTVSAVVWFLYGVLINDKYVALPNVLGFAFGIIQMVLYAVYRNATPKEEQAADSVSNIPEHVVAMADLDTSQEMCSYSVESLPAKDQKDNNRVAQAAAVGDAAMANLNTSEEKTTVHMTRSASPDRQTSVQ